MHGEPTRRLGHVASALFVDIANMLPARTVGRQRMVWRHGFTARRGGQRRDDVVRIGGFNQIIDGAGFHRTDHGRKTAIARLDNGARIRPPLLEGSNDIEAAAIIEPHAHHGQRRCARMNMDCRLGDRLSCDHLKAAFLQCTRKALQHRNVMVDDQQLIGVRIRRHAFAAVQINRFGYCNRGLCHGNRAINIAI